MDSKERQHLEYRPRLTYSRDLKYLAQKFDLPPDRVGTYEMPPELADATALLAAGVLQDIQGARDKAAALLADLKRGAGDLPGPVSLGDYERAVADGDHDTIAAFEGFHADDPDGTAQGELLPLVAALVGELGALAEEVAATLIPTGMDLDDPARAMAAEQEMLDRVIAQDIADPTKTDLPGLALRAQLLHAAVDQAGACEEVLGEIVSALKSTTNDQFGGKVRQVIAEIASAPDGARTGMTQVNRLRFRRLAQEGRSVRAQTKSLDAAGNRRMLWRAVRDLYRQRQEVVVPTLRWLQSIDRQWGKHPMTGLMYDAVDTMEQIAQEQEEVLLDLFKQNLIEKLQRLAWLANVKAKKGARQVTALLSTVEEHFDFEDMNGDRQVRRLVENHSLEKPGTIQSK